MVLNPEETTRRTTVFVVFLALGFSQAVELPQAGLSLLVQFLSPSLDAMLLGMAAVASVGVVLKAGVLVSTIQRVPMPLPRDRSLALLILAGSGVVLSRLGHSVLNAQSPVLIRDRLDELVMSGDGALSAGDTLATFMTRRAFLGVAETALWLVFDVGLLVWAWRRSSADQPQKIASR